LDSLANGLGYFLFPFMMGYSWATPPQAMPPRYYLLALCVAGVHSLATAADYDADRKAGHRTMAVAFGRRTAAMFTFATFLISLAFGDFHGVAVRVYLGMGAAVTLLAALVPRERVIVAACIVIFAGFLIAGLCHLSGL
jgi:4-hydroxybenzoate polyprenyltransferase